MEKLSRSQRYANLRDSITTDQAENTVSNELSGFQDRLNGVQNSFIASNAPAQPAYSQPVNNAQPQFTAPVQQTYTAPVQPTFTEPQRPQYTAPVQPQFTAPTQPQFTAPVQQTYTAPVQPTFTEPARPQFTAPTQPQFTAPVQPQFTAPETTYTAPKQTEYNDRSDEASLDELLNGLDFNIDNTNDVNAKQFTAPVEPVYTAPQPAYTAPVQPVQPEYTAPVQPVFTAPTNNEPLDGNDPLNEMNDFDFDSFINQTLTEVEDYNKNKGLSTYEDISKDILTEISNEQKNTFVAPEPQYSQPVVEPQYSQPVPQPQYNAEPKPANEKIIENSFVDDFLSKETSNEHPVAYQSLEEDKGSEEVEIVNLADLEKTESMTKTVAFTPVEEEKEEDVDTPNKVLNVLLVVLIIALFLVLGFVVYELISANII